MNRYDVCFRITGAEMQPDVISKRLKISPDDYFIPHAPTGIRNGKVVERVDSSVGIWALNSVSETEPIPIQMKKMIDKLLPLRDELLELKKSGLKVEFFCGYFSSNILGDIFLSSSLIEEIGSLGIDFDLALYFTGKEAGLKPL